MNTRNAFCAAEMETMILWSIITFSEEVAENIQRNTVCMFIFAIVAAIFMGLTAVHQNGEVMDYLHKYGQRKAMKEQGWSTEDFMKVFGANYL